MNQLDKSYGELQSEFGCISENEKIDSAIISRCAADIKPVKIDWLWHHRFARGKVSMIVGDPGLGKSQIIANMTATISQGADWPDKSTCEPGTVFILSAEDNAEDTIVPRLIAANADLSKVHIIEAVKRKSKSGADAEDQFSLDTDLYTLDSKLNTLPAAAIFIDPITAYLGSVDSHNNAAVRGILSLVSKLAEKHNIAVICISHLNKNNLADPISRVTGSGAFVAASRGVFVVVGDKDDDSQRLFLPLKNNIGGDKIGLSFRVESCTIKPSNDHEITISKIAWLSDNVSISVEEAMSRNPTNGEQNTPAESQEYLLDLLADGGMLAKEVLRLATDEGFTAKSIRAAKKKLNIRSRRDGFGKGSVVYWHLPNSKSIIVAHTCPTPTDEKYAAYGTYANTDNTGRTIEMSHDDYEIH